MELRFFYDGLVTAPSKDSLCSTHMDCITNLSKEDHILLQALCRLQLTPKLGAGLSALGPNDFHNLSEDIFREAEHDHVLESCICLARLH